MALQRSRGDRRSGIANDVLSYEKQHRLGRQKDIVDILVAERNCTPEEALEQAVGMVNGWMADFEQAEKESCAQLAPFMLISCSATPRTPGA
ncbi:hypothetical protein [Streptomyces sp. B6B3]|uniref:terpene synthase family protein n=1 Tax=Streptomyces sp. B6B3 TaxID=3153570 RepID=UPI00325D8570